ncbi:hypothetical protein [Oscillatoria sp. FACHB-1407]|nr:hypothetical protein [Oscillatoria sp. FACHB-1407]
MSLGGRIVCLVYSLHCLALHFYALEFVTAAIAVRHIHFSGKQP